jgi:hypothetical protein
MKNRRMYDKKRSDPKAGGEFLGFCFFLVLLHCLRALVIVVVLVGLLYS